MRGFEATGCWAAALVGDEAQGQVVIARVTALPQVNRLERAVQSSMIRRWPICLLVALPLAAYSDVSPPSAGGEQRTPANTWATAIRMFNVDGVTFIVSARPRPLGRRYLVEVKVLARSVDGAEHYADVQPLSWDGMTTCADGSGSGTGTALETLSDQRRGMNIKPSQAAEWSRTLEPEYAVARGCRLELEVGLIEFLRKDGSRKPRDLARVVLRVPLQGAPSVSVEPMQ
jgi:hypothetical protein